MTRWQTFGFPLEGKKGRKTAYEVVTSKLSLLIGLLGPSVQWRQHHVGYAFLSLPLAPFYSFYAVPKLVNLHSHSDARCCALIGGVLYLYAVCYVCVLCVVCCIRVLYLGYVSVLWLCAVTIFELQVTQVFRCTPADGCADATGKLFAGANGITMSNDRNTMYGYHVLLFLGFLRHLRG